MGKDDLWSREQVAERIIAGDTLVIKDGLVLRIPQSWLERHPGGKLAILHFVGRDASDEIHAYHSDAALEKMGAFVVGKAECSSTGWWQPFLPPVMSGWRWKDGKWNSEAETTSQPPQRDSSTSSRIILVQTSRMDKPGNGGPTLSSLQPLQTALCASVQREHSIAYTKLHQKIKDSGLYSTPFVSGYGPDLARYLLLAACSMIAYRYRWFLLSATFLGAVWHQVAFTAHDLGHNGVTHNWIADRMLGVVVAALVGGLSICWWADNHNIHHLVTNHLSHDPDIQHIPFFAISPDFSLSLWSSYHRRKMKFDKFAQYLISVQSLLFYAIMSLARLNLYAQSYSFLVQRLGDSKHARGGKWVLWLEIFAITIFWSWYTSVLRGCGDWKTAIGYFFISHIVSSPLHVQIVLSHFARSTEDLGPVESFPHRQLRTTTDVVCPESLEFIHGGLHLQVTHHLFPRLPRHNLRRASQLVKEFTAEQGLEYAEFGFIEGNAQVHGVLRSVSHQISIMRTVAKSYS